MGKAYRTEGAKLATAKTPNPDALTLRLCRRPSEKSCHPFWMPDTTGRSMLRTKKANISITLDATTC